MKVAAMKLEISEIRRQICRSHMKILVKGFIQNTTLTSLLDYLLRTSFWRRLQKNDTVEVASEKESFLLALTKIRSQWLKFPLVQLLLKRVHPKLRSPF